MDLRVMYTKTTKLIMRRGSMVNQVCLGGECIYTSPDTWTLQGSMIDVAVPRSQV